MKLLKFKVIYEYLKKAQILLVIGYLMIFLGILFAFWNIFDWQEFWLLISFFGVVYVIIYFFEYFNFTNSLKKLDKKLVQEISCNISNHKYIFFERIWIIAFDEYFICMSNSFELIRYDDLVWIYHLDYNNFPKSSFARYFSPHLFFSLNNGDSRNLFLNKYDNYTDLSDFVKYVKSKNDNVVVGYDKEIREKMKDRVIIK